jgi:hypothetical protein
LAAAGSDRFRPRSGIDGRGSAQPPGPGHQRREVATSAPPHRLMAPKNFFQPTFEAWSKASKASTGPMQFVGDDIELGVGVGSGVRTRLSIRAGTIADPGPRWSPQTGYFNTSQASHRTNSDRPQVELGYSGVPVHWELTMNTRAVDLRPQPASLQPRSRLPGSLGACRFPRWVGPIVLILA